MPGIAVRLCENLRTIVYAPFYFALSGAHLVDQGLAVTLVTSAHPSRTVETLLEGIAGIAWGGPMRVLVDHDSNPASPLVCFAQVVARDPFLLIGRTPNPRFRLADLRDLRVAVASEVPTPWMTFQDDLSRAGLDPAALLRTPDRPMADNVADFLRGDVDVIQVFEPWADRLTQSGESHVWHRFSTRGDIGYSTFYTTRSFIGGNRDVCRRLVVGMARAQQAFHAAAPSEIAASIAGFFPDLEHDAVARIVAGYRDAGLWARTPHLPLAAVLRLKAALVSGGLIHRDIDYAQIVDASLSSIGPA
ncbi:MAG: ABC transporter substrate-binding protein [Acetobacteraceae bacterium]